MNIVFFLMHEIPSRANEGDLPFIDRKSQRNQEKDLVKVLKKTVTSEKKHTLQLTKRICQFFHIWTLQLYQVGEDWGEWNLSFPFTLFPNFVLWDTCPHPPTTTTTTTTTFFLSISWLILPFESKTRENLKAGTERETEESWHHEERKREAKEPPKANHFSRLRFELEWFIFLHAWETILAVRDHDNQIWKKINQGKKTWDFTISSKHLSQESKKNDDQCHSSQYSNNNCKRLLTIIGIFICFWRERVSKNNLSWNGNPIISLVSKHSNIKTFYYFKISFCTLSSKSYVHHWQKKKKKKN